MNLAEIDFLNRWSYNSEILDVNVYFALFGIYNEFLQVRPWMYNSKSMLMLLIREKQIDGNINIIDFYLKYLKGFCAELNVYQKANLEGKRLGSNKSLRHDDKKYERAFNMITIVNSLLKKVHDFESLLTFIVFLGKMLEYNAERPKNKIFIETLLLDLDERYGLNIFMNKTKNQRLIDPNMVSATTDFDRGSDLNQKPTT